MKVGCAEYFLDGKCIGSFDVITAEGVEKITFFDLFKRILRNSITVR